MRALCCDSASIRAFALVGEPANVFSISTSSALFMSISTEEWPIKSVWLFFIATSCTARFSSCASLARFDCSCSASASSESVSPALIVLRCSAIIYDERPTPFPAIFVL